MQIAKSSMDNDDATKLIKEIFLYNQPVVAASWKYIWKSAGILRDKPQSHISFCPVTTDFSPAELLSPGVRTDSLLLIPYPESISGSFSSPVHTVYTVQVAAQQIEINGQPRIFPYQYSDLYRSNKCILPDMFKYYLEIEIDGNRVTFSKEKNEYCNEKCRGCGFRFRQDPRSFCRIRIWSTTACGLILSMYIYVVLINFLKLLTKYDRWQNENTIPTPYLSDVSYNISKLLIFVQDPDQDSYQIEKCDPD
jgi:hypothetical protein